MTATVKQSWWQLTSIQVGIIICLPAIMVGHVLYAQAGLWGALLGLIGGSILLWGLALLSLNISLRRPTVIIEIAQEYLGKYAQTVCGLAFALSLCGWFTIQLNLMSQTIFNFLDKTLSIGFISPWMVTISLGLLITWLAIEGIKAIEWFANITLPLMVLTLLYAVMMVYDTDPIIQESSWSISPIALMMSSKLAGVVNIPTYYRFARSSRDAYVSISLVYLLFLPLIGFVGLMLAVFAPQLSLIEAITQSGGLFWEFWAVFFLIIAGWTTNNGNLFSSVMALRPLAKNRLSETSLTLLLGAFCTGLSCLNVVDDFQILLSGMGIMVGSMGSMIWARFLLNKFTVKASDAPQQMANQIIVICGVIVGFCTLFKLFTLTGFAFLDAMLVSAVGTLVWGSLKNG